MSKDRRATIWRYFTNEVWYFLDLTNPRRGFWWETAADRKKRMIRLGLLLALAALFAWAWTSDTELNHVRHLPDL